MHPVIRDQLQPSELADRFRYFVHFANGVHAFIEDEQFMNFVLPDLINMIDGNKWIGSKREQGFYKSEKGWKSESISDLDTMNRTQGKPA